MFLLEPDGMTSSITTSDPTLADTLLTLDIDGSANGVSTLYDVSSPANVSASMTPQQSGASPEPSTLALLAAGGCLLLWRIRRGESRL